MRACLLAALFDPPPAPVPVNGHAVLQDNRVAEVETERRYAGNGLGFLISVPRPPRLPDLPDLRELEEHQARDAMHLAALTRVDPRRLSEERLAETDAAYQAAVRALALGC